MTQKPTFTLHGRIVTMESEDKIIDDGYLAIKNGRIASITKDKNNLPPEFLDKKIIETEGTIYPGLIDLHNHFVYNVLPLWVVPKRYDNRSQWPSHAEYRSGVSKPIKQALAKYSVSAKALVRYVETKALISGTTTGQGMRTKVNGGSKLFIGSMRCVEDPGNPNLVPARSMVPDLVTTGATAAERIEGFRRALEDPRGGTYFYHLSEGIDERAHRHFNNLKDYNLITDRLAGIHSLGLKEEDLIHMAQKGAKVVWSPFSNMLLYGKTLDLKLLKESQVQFSLGCDWSPSGSKNLLQELKVAFHVNKVQGNIFTPFELAQSVTINAANVTRWQEHVGTLEIGKIADVIVVKGTAGDDYLRLIKTVEKDIELVVVDGIARYGNKELMDSLKVDIAHPIEDLMVDTVEKGLYLYCDDSPINDIGFKPSISTLTDIMRDLPGFVERMEQEKASLLDIGVNPEEEFTVELDNEFEIEEDVFQAYELPDDPTLFADPPMANSIEFDTHIVEGAEYWSRINAQNNITTELKDWLKECYSI